MSEALAMVKEMENKIKVLQKNCAHPPHMIKVWKDSSGVGRGALWPAQHIICRNCGKKKIIFELHPGAPYILTLEKEEGLPSGTRQVFSYFSFTPSYLYQLDED